MKHIDQFLCSRVVLVSVHLWQPYDISKLQEIVKVMETLGNGTFKKFEEGYSEKDSLCLLMHLRTVLLCKYISKYHKWYCTNTTDALVLLIWQWGQVTCHSKKFRTVLLVLNVRWYDLAMGWKYGIWHMMMGHAALCPAVGDSWSNSIFVCTTDSQRSQTAEAWREPLFPSSGSVVPMGLMFLRQSRPSYDQQDLQNIMRAQVTQCQQESLDQFLSLNMMNMWHS